MIARRKRQLRRAPDDANLDQARAKVSDLEQRAHAAAGKLEAEKRRNHFADRWRATLPPAP